MIILNWPNPCCCDICQIDLWARMGHRVREKWGIDLAKATFIKYLIEFKKKKTSRTRLKCIFVVHTWSNQFDMQTVNNFCVNKYAVTEPFWIIILLKNPISIAVAYSLLQIVTINAVSIANWSVENLIKHIELAAHHLTTQHIQCIRTVNTLIAKF